MKPLRPLHVRLLGPDAVVPRPEQVAHAFEQFRSDHLHRGSLGGSSMSKVLQRVDDPATRRLPEPAPLEIVSRSPGRSELWGDRASRDLAVLYRSFGESKPKQLQLARKGAFSDLFFPFRLR